MIAKIVDEAGQMRIRAARERLHAAQAVAEKAWSAWLAQRNDDTTQAFRRAIEEQSEAARELADTVKREHGVGGA